MFCQEAGFLMFNRINILFTIIRLSECRYSNSHSTWHYCNSSTWPRHSRHYSNSYPTVRMFLYQLSKTHFFKIYAPPALCAIVAHKTSERRDPNSQATRHGRKTSTRPPHPSHDTNTHPTARYSLRPGRATNSNRNSMC